MELSSTSLSLIQRVREGDDVAWSELARLYGPLVYAWCRTRSLDANDSADILQAVLLSVHRSIHQFRLGEKSTSFRGWLFGLTRNKIGDHFRALQKRQDQAIGGGLEPTLAAVMAPGSIEDDVNQVRRDRQFLLLQAAKQIQTQLSEEDWTIFTQTVVEGRSAPEVARELGLSAVAVRQRKSRVVRRLRMQFEGIEDFFDET